METSYSDANHAVLHAQNDRWGLGLIETINSGHNVAVVSVQNHRWGLGPIETCNFSAKVAVLNAKTADEGWGPYRLVILVLKSLFYIQKTQMRVGNHRDQ